MAAGSKDTNIDLVDAATRSIHEQGYCILPSLLDPAQLTAAQAAFERMLPTIMASGDTTQSTAVVAGRSPSGLLTQGVLGVPQDPFAPP